MSIVLKCVALGWAHLERSSRPLEPLFTAYAVTDMATIYIVGVLVGICICAIDHLGLDISWTLLFIAR